MLGPPGPARPLHVASHPALLRFRILLCIHVLLYFVPFSFTFFRWSRPSHATGPALPLPENHHLKTTRRVLIVGALRSHLLWVFLFSETHLLALLLFRDLLRVWDLFSSLLLNCHLIPSSEFSMPCVPHQVPTSTQLLPDSLAYSVPLQSHFLLTRSRSSSDTLRVHSLSRSLPHCRTLESPNSCPFWSSCLRSGLFNPRHVHVAFAATGAVRNPSQDLPYRSMTYPTEMPWTESP